MRPVHFHERQNFNETLFIVSLVLGITGLYCLFPRGPEGGVDLVLGLTGLGLLFVSVAALNFTTMSTWVYDDEIRVQFGRLLPYNNSYVSLRDVEDLRMIEIQPLKRVFGRGVHKGSYEEGIIQFFSARGDRGIMLDLGDKRVVVGTQFPEKLEESIRARLQSLKESDPAVGKR